MPCNQDCNQGRECDCECKKEIKMINWIKVIKALEEGKDTLEYEGMIPDGYEKAIQACKEALEQPAQEPVAWTRSGDLINLEYHKSQPDGDDYCIDLVCMTEKYDDFDVAIYTHPAPPKQTQEPKPPTILARLPNGATVSNVYEAYEAGLKEGKAKTQEPVTHVIGLDNEGKEVVVKLQKPLYTTPPAREWVGLSDNEIYTIGAKMAAKLPNKEIDLIYARAIEAKLREMNT